MISIDTTANMVRKIMYLGHRISLGNMEQLERRSTLVILTLCIHHYLETCGIESRGMLGVVPALRSKSVRVVLMRMGQQWDI